LNKAIFFLFIALICVFIESFFSMFEMAAVSLNKVKLYYKASKNNKKAKWLEFLLKKPSYLFGTTLIMVNTVMQLGSEAARRFYEALNLSPDWAPLSQIMIVTIFGELSPLFAARKHSEHVAYFFVPVVLFMSKILTPFIIVIDRISKFCNILFKTPSNEYFLSKEELEKALEEPSKTKKTEKNIDSVISNIFSLKEKRVSSIMMPLNLVKIIPSNMSIKEVKTILEITYYPFLPIYHKNTYNIVAISYPRDLLKVQTNNILDFSKPAWFISEDTLILNVLKQFRTNKQTIAVVLNSFGKSIGFVSLDQVEDVIFGEYPLKEKILENDGETLIQKTLPGEMLLSEFNSRFNNNLSHENALTLSDLICDILGHHPSEGEIVHFSKYEFIVLEMSILGIEKVKVNTIQ